MGNLVYSSTYTTSLTPSVWTLITASYSVAATGYAPYSYLFLYLDGTRVTGTNFLISASNFVSSTPYKVIIGGLNGFLGSMAHFRIFSPATNHVYDGIPSLFYQLSLIFK